MFLGAFIEKFSYKIKKIVHGGHGIIGNYTFFHVIFVAIVKMFRKSFDCIPFAVRCVIMPMHETSYMSVLPVIRILA